MTTSISNRLKGMSSLRVRASLTLAVLLGLLALMTASAAPAKAELADVGPVSPDNGYPIWYQDTNGIRLELGLDPNDPNLVQPIEVPDASQPIEFPNNFPPEAFWWTGDASVPISGGGSIDIIMAQEAAFLGEDAVPGEQISFSRIRILGEGLVPGGTYTIQHPFGEVTLTANASGAIRPNTPNATEDIGCLDFVPPAACDFDLALGGSVGPFLTWNNIGETGPGTPPAGYVGNPNIPHRVVGSTIADPTDPSSFRNNVKVEGPAGATGSTSQFLVSGKIHGATAFASPKGGVFAANQSISLTPTVAGAEIRYTTDPALADADIATSGNVFDSTSPINVTAAAGSTTTTTLRFLAIDPTTNEPSPVLKQTYTVDKQAPATPSVDLVAASDTGASRTDNVTKDTTPTFTGAAEAGSTVRLFDGAKVVGTVKAGATGRYSFTVSRLANGGHTVTAKATDAVGNASAASAGLRVTVDSVAPVVPPASLRPLPGSLTPDRTPTIKALVRDAQTDLKKSNIKLSIDTVPAAFGYNTATDRLSATSRSLAPGRHNALIIATDVAGNSLKKPWSFKVK